MQRRDSLNDLLREWDKVISKPQAAVPRIRVREPARASKPVVDSPSSVFLPEPKVIPLKDSAASVPPLPEAEVVPVLSTTPHPWDRLEAIGRRHRVEKIYAGYAEFLVFLYLKKAHVLSKGFALEKLQERNPGKVSRVLLGIDQLRQSIWWKCGLGGSSRKEIFWRDLVRIEYSWTSACFSKIQKRFPEGSIQRDIPPWNCFSLVTNQRTFDFYDLPECASSVSKEVVAVESGKLSIVSQQIENFLFALSYVIRDAESEADAAGLSPRKRRQLGSGTAIVGLFKNMQQLRLERGKMKLGYVFREPAGKKEFLKAMKKQAQQEDQDEDEEGEEQREEEK